MQLQCTKGCYIKQYPSLALNYLLIQHTGKNWCIKWCLVIVFFHIHIEMYYNLLDDINIILLESYIVIKYY